MSFLNNRFFEGYFWVLLWVGISFKFSCNAVSISWHFDGGSPWSQKTNLFSVFRINVLGYNNIQSWLITSKNKKGEIIRNCINVLASADKSFNIKKNSRKYEISVIIIVLGHKNYALMHCRRIQINLNICSLIEFWLLFIQGLSCR